VPILYIVLTAVKKTRPWASVVIIIISTILPSIYFNLVERNLWFGQTDM